MRINPSIFTGALGHVGFGSWWLGTGPTTHDRMNLPGKKRETADHHVSWMLGGGVFSFPFPVVVLRFPGGPLLCLL